MRGNNESAAALRHRTWRGALLGQLLFAYLVVVLFAQSRTLDQFLYSFAKNGGAL
jgi:hypothetical protein